MSVPKVNPPDLSTFRARWTRSRFAQFRRLFRVAARSSRFERQLARLIVLYEDLRIEVLAAALDPGLLPNLEAFGPNYLQLYFMLGAIGTAHEFRHALETINGFAEVADIQSRAPEYTPLWHKAIVFFRTNREKLRTIRNDVGGHFGEQAVHNAFGIIPDDYIISIEMQADLGERTRLLFPFSAELVAVALLKHLPGNSPEEKSKALLDLLQDCVEHAVEAVHFLAGSYLWDRM